MRILLVNPPQPYMVEKHTQAPLGILYLSAVIKREYPDVEVKVMDFSDHSVERAIKKILDSGPWDVCGFTATTLDYPMSLELKKMAKILRNDTHFIIGGPHATACPNECVEDGWDNVFIGESELSILKYINDLYIGMNGRPKRESIMLRDLGNLPYPDRDTLSWLGGRVLAKGNKSSINIMASRGCSRGCTFCASKSMWGKQVRWRTPEDVAEEVAYCINKYDEHIFRFSDDNIISNKPWVIKFCELVKPLKIKWRLSVRVDEAEPEILALLHNAGCVELGFGIESFDRKVLKLLNKQITPEQSVEAVINAHKAGIGSRLLMMINTPGETYKHTVDCNIEYLEKLKGKFAYLSVKPLVPFPGTDIWEHSEKFGVEIKTKDFSEYNMWMYGLNERGEREHIEKSILSIAGMTEVEQQENLNRMREYTETLSETARG